MVKQQTFPQPLEITLFDLDKVENLIRPHTVFSFEIEDPGFGKLAVQYSLGSTDALATSFLTFHRSNGPAIMLCTNHATALLLKKISTNLRDAMEGLIKEAIYETMRDLNGHGFVGDLKSTDWQRSIKAWHAKASARRIGARRGPDRDASGFVKRVWVAAEKIEGRITQDNLSEQMRITPRGLQKQMKGHGFAWSAVLDICKLAQDKRRT